MTDRIDLSHVSISPHQSAYEAFLQYDRFIEGLDFDPKTGLYHMAREAFESFDWKRDEPVIRGVRIYPEIGKGGNRPDESAIRKTIQDLIKSWDTYGYPYAATSIAVGGEEVVHAGGVLTEESLRKIEAFNVKGDRPMAKVSLLDPRDGEGGIVHNIVIQRGQSFDGKLLRRVRQGHATLTGYRIYLPFDSSRALDMRTLEEVSWSTLREGDDLGMRVALEFEVTEERILTYDGQEIGRVSGTPEKLERDLGAFPLFTPKGTFVIQGQERVPVIQLLPRPGIHLSPIEVEKVSERAILLRPEQGPSLKIMHTGLDQEGYCMNVVALGQAHDLALLLKALGLWDEAERAFSGHQRQAPPPLTLPESCPETTSLPVEWVSRLHTLFLADHAGFTLGDGVRKEINQRLSASFQALQLQAPGNSRHLTPEDFYGLIHYLRHAAQNSLEGDDPSDLDRLKAFLLHDQIQRNLAPVFQELKDETQAFLNKDPNPSYFRCTFRRPVDRTLRELFQGELCQPTDDTNPLAEISLRRKITLKGPGGIRHIESMLPTHRQVHPSHYARVCLAETPESESMGLNLHLALTARVADGTIKAAYRLNGQNDPWWLSFADERAQTLVPVMADDPLARPMALARKAGRVQEVSSGEITGQELYTGQMLGIAAGLIPFVQHNDNNRVMMGAKNMKQAVPLLFPETPLVRTGWEGPAARMSGHAVYARGSGTVEQVLEDRITIRADEGGEDEYTLLPMRPTFHGTITFHRVRVKKGDEVIEGQALADGACTRDGELALGVNLLAAYMPYYGLNFEDGIVISDRLVKEDVLTSLHLRAEEIEVYGDEDDASGPLKKASPGLRKEMLEFITFQGCFVKPGQEVRQGDKLFSKYKRTSIQETSVSDNKKDQGPKITRHYASVNGTVVYIERIPVLEHATQADRVRFKRVCWILEERKVAVGDKLMGRHGNKGVISRILPSHEMPHLEDGTPVDILLNPHGVVSRMNLGQILETHLGWILRHDPKKYQQMAVVPPFQKVPEEEIQGAFGVLMHTGITPEGKAHLWDPRGGERIKAPVTVGYQYFMKLNHFVEDKIHTRETGDLALITGQPVKGRRRGGGQRLGEMEVWGLLVHGARTLLQEFLTLKADAPKEVRRKLSRDYLNIAGKPYAPFPETLRSAVMLLRGLGLDLRFHQKDKTPLEIRGKMADLDHASIRFADESTIKAWARKNKVEEGDRPILVKGAFEKKTKGLFDPAIFKDSRFDMGYIELVEPVIHPLFYPLLRRWLKTRAPQAGNWDPTGHGRQDLLSFAAALVSTDLEEAAPLLPRAFFTVPADGEFLAGASFVARLKDEAPRTGATVDPVLEQSLIRVLPVLPLDFRPLRDGHGAVIINSSLNDLYRKVLLANRALLDALSFGQPGRALFYARAGLQKAVNRLMLGDNPAEPGAEKGIAGLIKGKEGIFRMHLLGKRVDASARSVIVPMPELRLDQVGIPLELAIGLVRSRLLAVLAEPQQGEKEKDALKRAEAIVANLHEPVWREVVRKRVFEEILKDAWLVLNRAPSLHKYNVLAFRPVHVPHKAIGLHPLVCGMFNADFDGDQMAVHLPLNPQAMKEAEIQLNPVNNLLSAAHGGTMLHLTQDIALGIYLLTSSPEGRKTFAEWFGGQIPEPSEAVTKKQLAGLVVEFYRKTKDPQATTRLAQRIMEEGFREATVAGITFSIFDVPLVSHGELDGLKSQFANVRDVEGAVKVKMRSLCGI